MQTGGPPWRRDLGRDAEWTIRTADARRGRARRPRSIPVVVAVVLQLPWFFFDLHRAVMTGGTATAAAVAAGIAVAASFLLLLSRRFPGPCAVAVAAACAPAIGLTSGPPSAALPLAFAIVFGVVSGARVWAWSTVAAFAVCAPVFAYLLLGSAAAMVRPLIVALLLCLLMGIGEAIRTRRERYAQLVADAAARRQSAAEAERTRIARELHDVLAHSLSQISVQAGVGLHLFDTRPEQARSALAAIRTTSNQALEEVRGVLGFLRAEGEGGDRAPLPDLSRLGELAESFGPGGMSVTIDERLDREVSQSVQLTLYRIVQEALTNAARHGRAAAAHVELIARAEQCTVAVTDDGGGADRSAQPGRGLTGMRERVELLGGSLQTESPTAGGFRVLARIPLPASHDAPTSGSGGNA